MAKRLILVFPRLRSLSAMSGKNGRGTDENIPGDVNTDNGSMQL